MLKQHRWSNYHPGIRMHEIPVPATVGGLIFTLGMTIVFLVGVPIAVWFLLASATAGIGCAYLLRWLHDWEDRRHG
jgi:Sec-independent protein secretion pathway component TatC